MVRIGQPMALHFCSWMNGSFYWRFLVAERQLGTKGISRRRHLKSFSMSDRSHSPTPVDRGTAERPSLFVRNIHPKSKVDDIYEAFSVCSFSLLFRPGNCAGWFMHLGIFVLGSCLFTYYGQTLGSSLRSYHVPCTRGLVKLCAFLFWGQSL